MVISTRAVVAVGVGVLGAACLVGPTFAQQKGAGNDQEVRKAANNAPAATAAKPAPVMGIGTVDIEAVFQKYDKFKAQQEEFQAAAMKKRGELMKLQAQYQDEAAKLQKMVPNSVDAKKIEDSLTQLKVQMEAGQQSAQREFSLRETEMLLQTYKEVQIMVSRVAEYKGLTYVVKISSAPVSGSNPDAVYAEMSRAVVYSDPRTDITNMVVANLNNSYKAAGGTAPKGNGTGAAMKGVMPTASPSQPPPTAPSPRQ